MRPPPTPLRIGAVLFQGFELLDLYGPLEILGTLEERVTLTTLAEKTGPVPSHQGPQGWADATLDDPAAYDLLVIPGGMGTRREVNNPAFIKALGLHISRARWVASICTGSALLAKTGLLDGHRATSNKAALDWVRSQGPRVHWQNRARWVEDGRFFTSSGVSAGMDMALALITRLYGEATSQAIANRAEYVWNKDPDNDPFARLP